MTRGFAVFESEMENVRDWNSRHATIVHYSASALINAPAGDVTYCRSMARSNDSITNNFCAAITTTSTVSLYAATVKSKFKTNNIVT